MDASARKRARLRAAGVLLAVLAAAHAAADDFLKRTAPLPRERAYHGSAVLGNHFYVFGGTAKDLKSGKREPSSSTDMATIGADSQIGPWTETTPLDAPRHYISNTTLVLNDTVYVIGGSTKLLDGQRLNTAIWSRPLPNGALLPWQTSRPFEGSGVSCAAAVSTAGYLHLLGGLDVQNVTTNAAWSVRLFSDGSLAEWQAAPPLPIPLWFHQAGVVAGRVYVWGGMTGPKETASTPTSRVFSAPVLGSGMIGLWREEQQAIPQPFYAAASATVGPYLMSFCPRYKGSTVSTDVWWTTVSPQGLAPWQRREAGVPMKAYHATGTDYRRGAIYLAGGQPDRISPCIGDAFFFQLNAQARELAEKMWTSAEVAHSNSVAGLSPSGAGTRLAFDADAGGAEGVLPGFLSLADARKASVGPASKPLVLYFTSPTAASAAEQAKLLAAPDAAALLARGAFAWIDASQFPQIAHQFGVYRVPTWIFYDASGAERGRLVGVQQLATLSAGLAR